jgi:hypothetical protein
MLQGHNPEKPKTPLFLEDLIEALQDMTLNRAIEKVAENLVNKQATYPDTIEKTHLH